MALSARHPTPRLRARRIGRMRARVRRKPGSGVGAPAGRRSGAAPLTTLRGRAVAPRARRCSRAPAPACVALRPRHFCPRSCAGNDPKSVASAATATRIGIGQFWAASTAQAELPGRRRAAAAPPFVRSRGRRGPCGGPLTPSARPSPEPPSPAPPTALPAHTTPASLSLLRRALAHLDGAPSLPPLTRGSQLLAERRASRAGAMDDPLGVDPLG